MDKRCRNAFDTLCMSEEKKEQVFEDICEKCEKRKTHRFPKIAVAACILAVAVPTVGIAGEKISAYVMSLKKDQMHAVFQISDSADEGTGEHEPILVYPTLHYQNGGLEINGEGFTNTVNNLLVAGEAVGGIHGRNRLMGNSLLDVIVFGRDAGKAAAAKAKDVTLGKMNLDHVEKYAEILKEAGIDTGMVSPQLLPNYAGKRHL